MSRRNWVKRFAIGTAVAAGAERWKSLLLADISPAVDPGNILSFKISDYPALQTDYGSIRFSLFGSSVRDGVITVTRAPGLVFYSTSAYCTHEGCIVDPYDHSEGTEAMICYCHGSVYNIQGQLITAATENQANLPAYNTSYADGVVKVEVPDLNVKVNSASLVTPGAGTRFRMTFSVKNGGKYRIHYTPNLIVAPVVISFASTENGAFSSSQFNSSTTGTKTVWVNAASQRGFYFVELLVTEYVS